MNNLTEGQKAAILSCEAQGRLVRTAHGFGSVDGAQKFTLATVRPLIQQGFAIFDTRANPPAFILTERGHHWVALLRTHSSKPSTSVGAAPGSHVACFSDPGAVGA